MKLLMVRRVGTQRERGDRFVGLPIDENLLLTPLNEYLGVVESHLRTEGKRQMLHVLARAFGTYLQQGTEACAHPKV